MGTARAPAGAPIPGAPPAQSPAPAPPDASTDVEVVLTPEGLARAGLKTATVGAVEATDSPTPVAKAWSVKDTPVAAMAPAMILAQGEMPSIGLILTSCGGTVKTASRLER